MPSASWIIPWASGAIKWICIISGFMTAILAVIRTKRKPLDRFFALVSGVVTVLVGAFAVWYIF